MKRLLIGCAGGTPSINVERSLRVAAEKYYLIGMDSDPYNIFRANVDERHLITEATEKEYLNFMRQDIFQILYNSGGVDEMCMLPGWRQSRGAMFEYRVAKFFKIPTFKLRIPK